MAPVGQTNIETSERSCKRVGEENYLMTQFGGR
jgi:hypothetical protein